MEERLRKKDYFVDIVSLDDAQKLVEEFHYAKGGANTATYSHGLFARDNFLICLGVAWWIPPTKSAAIATYPENWQGVLSLSRLVIRPEVPKNACTFLLAASMKLIDRKKWPCLVTYADEWQGHNGLIYRASNWKYLGKTTPESVWILDGRMLSRKAGPKTRTKAEMESLGARNIGRFSKHKYCHISRKENA